MDPKCALGNVTYFLESFFFFENVERMFFN
jgi:hypothetical protein